MDNSERPQARSTSVERPVYCRRSADVEVSAVVYKLLVGVALSACVAGCAHMPSHTEAMANSAPPAGCVPPATATRLPLRPSECAAFGRSWTQEDLKRTGALDLGRALQLMDPSVSSH